MGIFDQDSDNDNLVARMIAKRQGREPTQEEIDARNKIQNEAINLASGTIGSIGGPLSKMAPEAMNVAEQTLPSLAEKIKAAAMASKVKGPIGGLTDSASMYQKGTQSGDAIAQRFKQLREAMKGK